MLNKAEGGEGLFPNCSDRRGQSQGGKVEIKMEGR
jgi:hypothetical protein